MARLVLLVTAFALLGGCEPGFDTKYQDAQQELNARAADIKADADRRIAAREAADAALAADGESGTGSGNESKSDTR